MLLSLTVSLSAMSQAAPLINSVNDSKIIQGGTYFNTPNSKTNFINSHSDGLWLKSGVTIRGLEVTPNHNLTNNGGTIQLYAPGQVVRVDGNINVNGLTSGQGAYLDNGGKVLVNSAYLYQNGNILAGGNRGGQVNMNVNSASFGPQAKIDASSPNGIGESICINASGVVDIQRGAVLTTSGLHIPGIDSNLIEVAGRVVNNDGIINANGITANASVQNMTASSGGIIRLTANSGNLNLQPVEKALAGGGVFNSSERTGILDRLQGLAKNSPNSAQSTGSITANERVSTSPAMSMGGNGGVISILAAKNATLSGNISASKNLTVSAGQDIAIDPLETFKLSTNRMLKKPGNTVKLAC